MPETTGHACPECGAPRGAGNAPSCSCAERAAEALRDTRTAEAAAAEDFDPLRIRPYVELEGAAGPAPENAPPAEPDATMPLHVVTPPAPAPDETMALRVVTPPVPVPDADSVSMFDTDAPTGPDDGRGDGPGAGPGEPLEEPGAGTGPGPRRPRRAALLVASAVAVVAVVTGAAFASGVFSYDSPARDTAGSGEVRAAVPEESASASGQASSSPDASSSATASESADASPSASQSASPSDSASESASASASVPASVAVTPSKTPNGATASGQPQYGTGSGAVLRRGDSGPEVAELQLRLKQLWLFAGNADGKFDNQLENSVSAYQWTRGLKEDPKGVYGAETRAALEHETSQP